MQFRKKRDLSDVMSDSFLFIKEEIKPLWKLSLTYVLPFFLIFTYIQITIQQKMMGIGTPEDPELFLESLKPMYSNLFILFAFNLFVQTLYMGVIYSYIYVYIEKGKGNVTLQDVTSKLFANSLQLLGVMFITSFIAAFGLMLCFLPGIYFANTFSIAAIVVVMEKKGLGHALGRSWKLVNFQWFNTLGVNLMGLLFIIVASVVLSIPTMVTGFSSSFVNAMQGEPIEQPNWYWVVLGITTVISSFLYIIPYVFIAFQYFNLDEQTKSAGLFPEE